MAHGGNKEGGQQTPVHFTDQHLKGERGRERLTEQV